MTQEGLGGVLSFLDKDPDDLIPVALDATERASLSGGGLKIKKNSNVRRKRLHWTGVDSSKIGNTLWAEDDEDDIIQVNEEEFKRLFVEATTPVVKEITLKAEAKRGRVNLIDLKRGQNAGIALARIKYSDEDLRKMVLTLDASKLTSEQLKSMHEFLPSAEEIELIGAYTGDTMLLGRAEQYMSTMKELVATASKRIECLLFKQQFPASLAACKKMVNTMEKACDDVKLSGRFKKVLKTILKVGNQLNDGMGSEEQAGFTVDSLLKLQSAKAFDKKTSILQYVVTLIERSDPTLNKFTDDLPFVYDASRLNIDNIVSELNLIRKNLSSCATIIEDLEAQGDKEVENSVVLVADTQKTRNLSNDEIRLKSKIGIRLMNEFLAGARTKVQELQSHVEVVKNKFSSVLTWFGEESNMRSQDFFSTLHKFLVDFSNTHKVVERTIKREEKANSVSSISNENINVKSLECSTPNAMSEGGNMKSRRATVAIASSSYSSLSMLQSEPVKESPERIEEELKIQKLKEQQTNAEVDGFLDMLFDVSACSYITEFSGNGLLLDYGDKSLPDKSRRRSILAYLSE